MKAIKPLFFCLCLAFLLASCGSKKAVGSAKKPNNFSFEHEAMATKPKGKMPPAVEGDEEEFVLGSNSKLENFVADWSGTPHSMGGMTKNGVDCSGFVIMAYKEVFKESFKNRRAEDIFYELQPISREDLQPGDLVFFKINGYRIDHVGIYLGNQSFAHASSSAGVMISSLELDYFNRRFFKGGRKTELN